MDRLSNEYLQGVEYFLKVAERNAVNSEAVRCPCTSCGNCFKWTLKEIKGHLYANGIDQSYRIWIWHGEVAPNSTFSHVNMGDPIHHDNLVENPEDADDMAEMFETINEDFMGDPKSFEKLLEDAKKPFYKGCKKFTKMSALVSLLNLKAKSGWTDTSFSSMLQLFAQLLPEDNELPLSTKKAIQTLSVFGMGYEKIHACPNDCILYRKEYKDSTECPTCGTPRYKLKKNTTEVKVGVPAKVLWYFPPIPRFKRWFQSVQTAKALTWHANERQVDGKLRHPADSPAWKLVDDKWPEFGNEARNLRLALSADGINPHSTLSSKHSCWPVMLATYNFEPSLSTKRNFLMLTMLISGPRQPGNDIDVYLAPLIEDLKTLWDEGVHAYDAYLQESFTLKAILLWTINDFPAYGNLCGCAVKGYYACPICGEETDSIRLKHSKKNVYTSHRRFLPQNHPFRKQKKAFNGKQEFREQPNPLNGEQILEQVENINACWGKKMGPFEAQITKGKDKLKQKRKRTKENTDEPNKSKCWKKKSIFFRLGYWKHLLLRHNLDVMHIEKNVCDSIIGTLLNIPGKTKDGVKSRLDLVKLGLRGELAPQDKGKRTYLPPACYTLSREEKKRVCETLLQLKVPDGYSSNFSNLVSMEELKLFGLKSHDCHILMQQILPVAIRSVLPKHVRFAIIRVCFFFNALCAKEVDVKKLNSIQEDIVITLCLLEKYFPPAFFDIMVHLMVHLVREVELCGPVFARWMYAFERFAHA